MISAYVIPSQRYCVISASEPLERLHAAAGFAVCNDRCTRCILARCRLHCKLVSIVMAEDVCRFPQRYWAGVQSPACQLPQLLSLGPALSCNHTSCITLTQTNCVTQDCTEARPGTARLTSEQHTSTYLFSTSLPSMVAMTDNTNADMVRLNV